MWGVVYGVPDVGSQWDGVVVLSVNIVVVLLFEQDSEAPTLFIGSEDIHPDFLEIWLRFLSSHPRPLQLLHGKHPVVLALEQALKKHTHDVSSFTHQPDKRCAVIRVLLCWFKAWVG